MKKQLTAQFTLILLTLLITAVTFFHVNWLQKDTRNQPFIDPYPRKTLEFTDAISTEGIGQIPELLTDLKIGPRPPLYQLIASGFLKLFGRSIDAMLGANIFLHVVGIVAIYGAGTAAKNRTAGLLAALFFATYPPLVDLVRLARPHAIAPTAVALWLWAMLLLLHRRSWQITWFFTLSLAFGFLIHPNLFYLLGLPSLVFCIYCVVTLDELELPEATSTTRPTLQARIKQLPNWIWRRLNTPFVYKGLLPSLLTATVLTASWYLFQLKGVSNLVEVSASQWTSTRYGFSHIPASFWWYALTLPGAISTFFTFLLLVSLLIYLFARQRVPFFLAVTFLLMYLGFGLRQGTLAWMNLAPILPVAAVITAVFLLDFWEQTQSRATAVQFEAQQIGRLFALLLLLSAIFAAGFNFFVVTSTLSPNGRVAAQLLGAPIDTACGWRMNVVFCPNPPRQQSWPLNDILQISLKDLHCQETVCTLAIASESAESFSYTSLDFALSRDFPNAELDIIPIRLHGQKYSLDWLRSDYLLYIPQIKNNSYANAVLKFLQQPPASFANHYREVAQIQLPQGWTAVLLKQRQPLTNEEMVTYANMLELPNEVKANLQLDFSFQNIDK